MLQFKPVTHSNELATRTIKSSLVKAQFNIH